MNMIIEDNGTDEATAISDNALAVLELLNEIIYTAPGDCEDDDAYIHGLQKKAGKLLKALKAEGKA